MLEVSETHRTVIPPFESAPRPGVDSARSSPGECLMSPCAALVFLALSAGPYPYTGEPATVVEDIHRFPDGDFEPWRLHVEERVQYYRRQVSVDPHNSELWHTLSGWKHRDQAWYYLRRAREYHRQGHNDLALDYLRSLRQELGREAWYGGRMP